MNCGSSKASIHCKPSPVFPINGFNFCSAMSHSLGQITAALNGSLSPRCAFSISGANRSGRWFLGIAGASLAATTGAGAAGVCAGAACSIAFGNDSGNTQPTLRAQASKVCSFTLWASRLKTIGPCSRGSLPASTWDSAIFNRRSKSVPGALYFSGLKERFNSGGLGLPSTQINY